MKTKTGWMYVVEDGVRKRVQRPLSIVRCSICLVEGPCSRSSRVKLKSGEIQQHYWCFACRKPFKILVSDNQHLLEPASTG